MNEPVVSEPAVPEPAVPEPAPLPLTTVEPAALVDLLIQAASRPERPGDPPSESSTPLAEVLLRNAPGLSLQTVAELKRRVDQVKLQNPRAAAQYASLARAVADFIDEPEAAALAQWTTGNALLHASQYPETRAAYEAALAYYTTHSRTFEQACLHINLVAVSCETSEYRHALNLAESARQLFDQLPGDLAPLHAMLEMNVGVAHQQLGELAEAHEAFLRGRELFAALSNPAQAARMDINRAYVLLEQHRPAEAEPLLTSARATLSTLGQTQEVARADLQLGILAWRRGQLASALTSLEAAATVFEGLNNAGDAAVVALYRASIYRQLNLLQETLVLAGQAEAQFERDHTRWEQAMALLHQGEALRRLNLFPEAEERLNSARRILCRRGVWQRVLELDVERIHLALDQGHGAESIEFAERLLEDITEAEHPMLAARLHLACLRGLLQADLTDAQLLIAWKHARFALVLTELHPLSELRILALQWAGQVMTEAAGSLSLTHSGSVPFLSPSAPPFCMPSPEDTGMTSAGLAYAPAPLPAPLPAPVPTHASAPSHEPLHAHEAAPANPLDGSLKRQELRQMAAQYFWEAMRTVEQNRALLRGDELRLGFSEDKRSLSDAVAGLCLTCGDLAGLWVALTLAHSPLNRGAAPSDSDDQGTALQAQFSRLRAEWYWRLTQADDVKSQAGQIGSSHDTSLIEIESKLGALGRRLQALPTTEKAFSEPIQSLRLKALEPGGAALFTDELRRRLPQSGLLLQFYALSQPLTQASDQSPIQVVALTPTGPIHRTLSTTSSQVLKLLRSWRFHLDQQSYSTEGSKQQRPEARIPQALTRLYELLLRPIDDWLQGVSRLYVVLPPAWHELPLAGLHDGAQFLVERLELVNLSAADALLLEPSQESFPLESFPLESFPLESFPQESFLPGSDSSVDPHPVPSGHASSGGAALVMGYSCENMLPQAPAEAVAVAQALSPLAVTVRTESSATFDALRHHAKEAPLIHLATHAVYRADNPHFSWIQLADNRVTLADLYALQLLKRPCVVLSACETGRGQARAGGLLGLGRALLSAGAGGIIVSLWRIPDAPTARLMTSLYTHLGAVLRRSPALHPLHAMSALRQAQQEAVRRGEPPFAWAGFAFGLG